MFKSTRPIIANFPLNSGRCKKFGGGIKRKLVGRLMIIAGIFCRKFTLKA
jgi:hypothetical protein